MRNEGYAMRWGGGLRGRIVLWLMLANILLYASLRAQTPSTDQQLKEIVNQLRPDNPLEDRVLAVAALAAFGEKAIPVVPTLCRSLHSDGSAEVRQKAIEALMQIQDPSRRDISPLCRALAEDKDARVRRRAADALGIRRIADVDVIQSLTHVALFDSDRGVRQAAASSLGRLGSAARPAVVILRKNLLGNGRADVRAAAAESLSKMVFVSEVRNGFTEALLERQDDPAIADLLKDSRVKAVIALVFASRANGALEAVPDLRRSIKSDPSTEVRLAALAALGSMRGPSSEAIPELRAILLKDPNPEVRAAAVETLWPLASRIEEVVPDFQLALLNDRSPIVRAKAARNLGAAGEKAIEVAPFLRQALLHDTSMTVRKEAAEALMIICKDVQEKDHTAEWNIQLEYVPTLRDVFLHDSSPSVRGAAATALSFIDRDDTSFVPQLLAPVIQESDFEVETGASMALTAKGIGAREAIPDLIRAIQSQKRPESPTEVIHADAAVVLEAIVKDARAKGAVGMVGSIREIASAFRKDGLLDNAKDADEAAIYLEGRMWFETSKEIRAWVVLHESLLVWIAAYFLLQVVWLALLWLRPLSLIVVSGAVKRVAEIEVKGSAVSFKGALETLSLLNLFVYHPRVLDAWVSRHMPAAKANFLARQTVSDRAVHVETPVVVDGNMLPALMSATLQQHFENNRCTVLIWGEGGSGKTSLACQVARWAMAEKREDRLCSGHPMIPVIIEDDPYLMMPTKANFEAAGILFDKIHGQLNSLIGGTDPIPSDLLYKLVTRGRVLVILDGYSEYGDTARHSIVFDSIDFRAKMLVVTSRSEEKLNSVPRVVVRPTSVEGNRLSVFMDAYLSRRGMREAFQDSEYFSACGRLTEMVGSRKITAMLAKLYAEMMIANKQMPGSTITPTNIPELMVAYVSVLNRARSAEQPTNDDVIYVLKRISWECMKERHKPSASPKLSVLAAISEEEPVFDHIERNLRLIQVTTTGMGDLVRVTIDPLAEYFAGLFVIESFGANSVKWQELLGGADLIPADSREVPSFVVALRDCCEVYGQLYGTPAFVLPELNRRAFGAVSPGVGRESSTSDSSHNRERR